MRSSSALLFLATTSCLIDWSSVSNFEGGAPPMDAGDSGITKMDACTPSLVVNEVKADGTSPSDEYVEIFNLSSCTTALTGWTLYYSSSAASTPFLIWTGTAADTIDANGYFVLCGDGFTPAANVHYARWQNLMQPPNGILSKNGGGVGLFNPGMQLVDGVAYAAITAPMHPFIEPKSLPDGGPATPAPNPPTGQSISRLPNGADSNVNAVDFKVTVNMTPGAAN